MKNGRMEYDLTLTNMEVRIMFEQMIEDWFLEYTPTAYNSFLKALLLGNLDAMNEYMNRVVLTTFSFFVTGREPSAKAEPERFYHGFVLRLMVNPADRYTITSNRQSGFGRYDALLEPKSREDDAFILELKVYNSKRERAFRIQLQRRLPRSKKSSMKRF